MSTFSEVGHGKNVANFEDLISYCAGYGAAYNPSSPLLGLSNMNSVKANADAVLASAVSSFNAFKNATNDREIAFKPLKAICTRVMSVLKASGVKEQTFKDAQTINHKIQGKRAKAIKTPEPAPDDSNSSTTSEQDASSEVNTVSTSQQSYDSKIEFFGKLTDLLSTIPAYAPNEPDLQLTALNTLLSNMKASNTAVISATTNMSNAMIARNAVIYDPVSGLVEIAQEVKAYVKGVFGAQSPQYKQVSHLKFTRRV